LPFKNYLIDRNGIIANSKNKRSMANVPELSFIAVFHEEFRKDRGEHREASSRFSLVAYYGTHP